MPKSCTAAKPLQQPVANSRPARSPNKFQVKTGESGAWFLVPLQYAGSRFNKNKSNYNPHQLTWNLTWGPFKRKLATATPSRFAGKATPGFPNYKTVTGSTPRMLSEASRPQPWWLLPSTSQPRSRRPLFWIPSTPKTQIALCSKPCSTSLALPCRLFPLLQSLGAGCGQCGQREALQVQHTKYTLTTPWIEWVSDVFPPTPAIQAKSRALHSENDRSLFDA